MTIKLDGFAMNRVDLVCTSDYDHEIKSPVYDVTSTKPGMSRIMKQTDDQVYQLWVCNWFDNTSETLFFSSQEDARLYATSVISENIDATIMDEDNEEIEFYDKRI